MAFSLIVAFPASLITRGVFERIGILAENENDYQEKNKKDKLFWSVFLYFCVVVFSLEQYLYSKVRYGEENLIVALIFILVATIVVVVVGSITLFVLAAVSLVLNRTVDNAGFISDIEE